MEAGLSRGRREREYRCPGGGYGRSDEAERQWHEVGVHPCHQVSEALMGSGGNSKQETSH